MNFSNKGPSRKQMAYSGQYFEDTLIKGLFTKVYARFKENCPGASHKEGAITTSSPKKDSYMQMFLRQDCGLLQRAEEVQPTWVIKSEKEKLEKIPKFIPLSLYYHLQMPTTGQTHVETKLLMSEWISLPGHRTG